jgi:hypothetical protein
MSHLQRLVPAIYFQETTAPLGQEVGNHGVIAGFTINDEDFYRVLLFQFCGVAIIYYSSRRPNDAASDILNST